MPTKNHFEATLRFIQSEVRRHSDVQQAVRDAAFNVIDGICNHPFDCGIRRFRSFSISQQQSTLSASNPLESSYLLTVRGVREDGTDVVSFTSGPSPEHVLTEFCHRASLDSLTWKHDERRAHAGSARSFLDTLVDQASSAVGGNGKSPAASPPKGQKNTSAN